MTHFMAVDLGTTGAKAVLFDADGRALTSTYRDYPTHSAEGGVVEQRVTDWWSALDAITRELTASRGAPDAIALTGQMQNAILLDAQGQPVRPVILYSDTRAQPEADAVNAALGAARLEQLTGSAPGPAGLLAKLRWIATREPNALARTATILLGAADAAAFHWCGAQASDTTTASTTGLMALEARAWLDDSLFEAAGLHAIRAKLPLLLPGGALAGHVSDAAATRSGLKPGTPIYLGPGDAGATTLGAGSGEPGSAYLYLGSSGWVAFTSARRPAAETGVFTLAHPRTAHFIAVAPLLTAGGNLDWIKGIAGAPDYVQLIDSALTAHPSSLIYLPYLNGERSPFNDPLARGAFIGLNASHTRADLARAVLEGVALAYRHVLDTLLPAPPAALILTGGGARSPGWSQMLADVTGVAVDVAADARNVGARGAVLAAQVARGEAPSYGLTVERSARFQPNAAAHTRFSRQYALFRDAYPALRPLFARQGEVSKAV
jgi:xylulokinase